MEKIKEVVKKKFLNSDGSINKTALVSVITLIIVLINQTLAIFGVTPQHEDQAVAVINTLLTLAGIFGFIEPSQQQEKEDEKTGTVTPTVQAYNYTNAISPSTIKALTSLASQAEQLQSESIAAVSQSILAEQNNGKNSAKSAK